MRPSWRRRQSMSAYHLDPDGTARRGDDPIADVHAGTRTFQFPPFGNLARPGYAVSWRLQSERERTGANAGRCREHLLTAV